MIAKKNIPVFDLNVWMATTREDAASFLASRGSSLSVGQERGFSTVGDDFRLMAVFEGGPAIAIHEAVHMAWDTLADAQVKIGKSNQEPLAYLAAWLAVEMIQMLELGSLDVNPCAKEAHP